jgi:Glycosyltransferase family 87
MGAARGRFPHFPRWLLQGCLVLSLAYLVSAGVIAPWSPTLNGLDLSVCYVAGATASRGASPYQYAELTETRRTLQPAVAAKLSLPFGYPPSAIPACVLLSRLPWQVALAVWKLLNLAFLIGCVLLTFRLFPDLGLGPDAKYLAWSFVFAFSPSVSVILVGQSSLFVLSTALLSIALSEQGRPAAAGVCLGFALIKPHLVFPFIGLLLMRRQYRVVLVASATTAMLAVIGLRLGHDSLESFLEALRVYTSQNSPTNPRLVGIQNLATSVFNLPPSLGRTVAISAGVVLIALALALERFGDRPGRADHTLPLILVVSVLGFGAHSYDMVFLIPVGVWAIGRVQAHRRYLPIVLVCFLLVLPLGAVTLAYERLLSDTVPDSIFRVAIEPFRSWALVILLTLVMYVALSTDRPADQPTVLPSP